MEEADALCSRIAIVSEGRLQCVGNQLGLKNRFGDGYKLTLTLSDPTSVGLEAARAFVSSAISRRSRLVSHVGATAVFALPVDGVDVAAVFQLLHSARAAGGVTGSAAAPPGRTGCFVEYGISPATLEDVFIRVCEAGSTTSGGTGGGSGSNTVGGRRSFRAPRVPGTGLPRTTTSGSEADETLGLTHVPLAEPLLSAGGGADVPAAGSGAPVA